MAGNILGARSYYGYIADSSTIYSIQMDDTLAVGVGATLDDSSPNLPRRFEPRVVFCEAIVGGRTKRKQLVVTDPESVIWTSETTQNIDLDGVTFATTGKRGEKVSFSRNADSPDPGDEDGTGGGGT